MSEDINPELIEKAAIATYEGMQHPNWRAPLWDEIDEPGRERFLNVARAALSTVLPYVIRQAKAEAWDEGHYMSELNLRHAYDGHDCEEGEMCPTCCQPNPYRSERNESPDENPVLMAMAEYGEAIRSDWSNFDGGTEQSIIDGWVQELRQPDSSHDIEWHRRVLGICMAGGGHWCGRWGWCDDECGCVPCAEDRSAR